MTYHATSEKILRTGITGSPQPSLYPFLSPCPCPRRSSDCAVSSVAGFYSHLSLSSSSRSLLVHVVLTSAPAHLLELPAVAVVISTARRTDCSFWRVGEAVSAKQMSCMILHASSGVAIATPTVVYREQDHAWVEE